MGLSKVKFVFSSFMTIQLAGEILRMELAHWLLGLYRHGERVTSQPETTDVCIYVCVRVREGVEKRDNVRAPRRA